MDQEMVSVIGELKPDGIRPFDGTGDAGRGPFSAVCGQEYHALTVQSNAPAVCGQIHRGKRRGGNRIPPHDFSRPGIPENSLAFPVGRQQITRVL